MVLGMHAFLREKKYVDCLMCTAVCNTVTPIPVLFKLLEKMLTGDQRIKFHQKSKSPSYISFVRPMKNRYRYDASQLVVESHTQIVQRGFERKKTLCLPVPVTT